MNESRPDKAPRDVAVVFWRNKLTFAGALISYTAIVFLGCFLLIGLVAPVKNPYVGLWFYLVLPGFLLLGLLLMPLGLLFEWRRRWRAARHNGGPPARLRLDLGLPDHRKLVKFVIVTTVFVVPAVAMTSYHGYHYTDSTEFCAKICHTVMQPQFVAQQRSPHARVPCVECHIGSGAEWYVRSKLSGARQVLAVMRDSYHRPIPPAITELRPAVETCQECHWPEKFYGDQLIRIAHYASDEGNTPRHLEMIVKTGGGDPKQGPARGIHWHMALSNRIEYVATDEGLQEIIWVRQTTADGQTKVYRRDGRSSGDPKPAGIERTLDCMDCHNRAAHDFYAPQSAVDLALDVEGMIDRALPYIKREAVAALLAAAERPETAAAVIDRHLTGFYEANYPRVAREESAAIRQAVAVVTHLYQGTFFPQMKVDWRTYPDNIGHKDFPGCFRCHNGDMVSDDGAVVRRTCASCHAFLEKQSVDDESTLIKAGRFVHPVPLVGAHAAALCSQCHTGGAAPDPSCAGCHTLAAGLARGDMPELERFGLGPGPLAGHACEACHDLTKPTQFDAIAGQCAGCHAPDAPDAVDHARLLRDWNDALRAAEGQAATAVEAVRDRVQRSPAAPADILEWLQQSDALLERLRHAGGLHHAEGAIKAYNALSQEADERSARLVP